jgi:signal transduction histidine kinase
MRSDTPGVGAGGTTLRVSFSDITHRIEAEQRIKGMSLRLLGAQEEARRLLANELHNRTSANLAALGVNLDVADIALNSCDWQEISARMSDNRALVQDTQSSIREICAELRPPALDYAGLIPAIESHCPGSADQHRKACPGPQCPGPALPGEPAAMPECRG